MSNNLEDFEMRELIDRSADFGAQKQRAMDGPVIVALQNEVALLRQTVIELEQEITGHLGTIAGLRRNAKDRLP